MSSHQDICPFCKGMSWHTFDYLEGKLLELSRSITIDEANYSTWSESLAEILVLTGNAMDTFFRKMSECPNFIQDSKRLSIKKDVDRWGISEYRKIYEPYYELSENTIFKHVGLGKVSPFRPFNNFKDKTPIWWVVYNKIKHEYYDNLELANLSNVLNCLGGLLILNALHLCSKRYLALVGKIVDFSGVKKNGGLAFELLRSRIGRTRWVGTTQLTTKIFYFEYRYDDSISVNDHQIIQFHFKKPESLWAVVSSPTQGPVGSVVTLTCINLTKDGPVSIYFDGISELNLLQRTKTNDDGSISTKFEIPQLAKGKHTIIILDEIPGLVVQTPFQII